MHWQDLAFTVGSLILTIGILPMVWHEHKPPLSASVPVFLVLYFFAFTYTTLGFVLAPAIEAFQATLWLVLSLQRVKETGLHTQLAEAWRDIRNAVPDDMGGW